MNRREFVQHACIACASGTLLTSLLASCSPAHYVAGTWQPEGLTVARASFTSQDGVRRFVVVHDDKLEYPIYVFQHDDTRYTALWMQCTHQGAELQASGDQLHCPSHGSEFDNTVRVTHGPAE